MKQDWANGISETLTWNTRVSIPLGGIDSNTGDPFWRQEYREPLAPMPGCLLSHSEWMTYAEEGKITSSPTGLAMVMPYYPGTSTVEVSGTVSSIYIEKADRKGFRTGGLIVFVHQDGTITAKTVVAVMDQFPHDGAIIDYGDPVTISAGDLVMPGVSVRRNQTLTRSWSSAQVWSGSDTMEAVPHPASIAAPPPLLDHVEGWESHLVDIWRPTELSELYEVVWWDGNDSSSLTIGENRHRAVGGAWVPKPTHQEWVNAATRTRMLIGKDEIWSARKMLYRRQGKANAAFIPMGQSLPFLGIRSYNGFQYAAFDPSVVDATVPYQAIMFKGFQGERAYAAPSVWADENQMLLPVPPGEVWLAARLRTPPTWPVESVDWLVYSRLDSDSVTIHYTSPELASVTLPWISAPAPNIDLASVLDPPIELLDLRMPEGYWATLSTIEVDRATYPDLCLHGMKMPEAYWATLAGMEWIRQEPHPDLLLDGMKMPEAYWSTLSNIVAEPLNPIQKIILTNPTHFWYAGVNHYAGVDLILDRFGDLVTDDSTAVKTFKAIVGGEEITFDGTTPLARWEDGRIVPHITAAGTSAGTTTFSSSVADHSIVAVMNFVTTYGNPLMTDSTTAVGSWTASSALGISINGLFRIQTVQDGDWTVLYGRDGAARWWQAIGSGNDAVNGPTGGAGALALGSMDFVRPLQELVAIIVYDDGERVGELLDQGLLGLIEELKNYIP